MIVGENRQIGHRLQGVRVSRPKDATANRQNIAVEGLCLRVPLLIGVDNGEAVHRRGGGLRRGAADRLAGLARGLDRDTLILLCILTAISAIPAGLPTFVQLMLSSGAQRLAQAKAVVKSLQDVETLGATSAINSDKTGTLTRGRPEITALEVAPGEDEERVLAWAAAAEAASEHPLASAVARAAAARGVRLGGVSGGPAAGSRVSISRVRPSCSDTARASGRSVSQLLFRRASAPTAKESRLSLAHLEVFSSVTYSLVMAA